MDAWTMIAYAAFGSSLLAAALRVGNWALRADPRTIVNAGRWSLIGLAVAAIAALVWLAASGRWTLAMMLAAFIMPVFVQGRSRWRTLLGPFNVLRGGWRITGRGYRAADRAGMRDLTDPQLVQQSIAVLTAYLDHVSRASGRKQMSVEEALEILGLARGARPDQVREAHRRLQRRVDPEQGGTDYLTTKINEAKDVLLGQ